jgi:hypothetical protein
MARAFGGTGEKKESADASDVGDTGDCDVVCLAHSPRTPLRVCIAQTTQRGLILPAKL